ncbi:hypothetical protein GLYMA_13G205100v4 [Glycine max]|nr:putative golgin subfamily A member 6-like protein 3 [Glycine max]XP_040864182.1 putative golgin subfamily A member 6-like protein 3 [Glycine max]KAG4384050.1 hypothetical protein GLYMA_13G205100v4 [Glycine max]KAG4960132.1 hypothetical protein JHK87_036765 [Glycine soja]KAH1102497.1 hypothetical protein GYH30_036843 [Glycine max]
MASSNNNIQAISRSRKHQNSAVTIALGRRRGTHKKHSGGGDGNCSSPVVNSWEGGSKKSEVSARKLAAGLWQMQYIQVSRDHHAAAFGHSSFPSSMSQLANGNAKIRFPHYDKPGEKFQETKDQLKRPITILRSRNGLRSELESSMPHLNGSKEMATEWSPTLNEASNEFIMIHSRKLLEDKKLVGDHNSVVSTLLEELLQAQRSINKLKAEQKTIQKNVEHFLQNLKDDKIFLKSKEHHKIKATIGELKGKLERERRSRERMELLNTKLVHELAEANLLRKQFMTNCEKEKKERELMEEMCEELAMQIGEDKAKLTVILSESKRICEEVEEERNMMQMAELWREERVQMKLVDAQFVLEDKYNRLVQLAASLERFLISRGAELDTTELEDAELIKQEVESLNIQRVMELSFDV